MRWSRLSPAAELFGDGWSRVRGRRAGGGAGGVPGSSEGSLLSGRRAQMARAARGHSPAIFKAIRKGGCHSRAELGRQLTYLTTKSAFILDSRGEFDGRRALGPAEIKTVTRRFADQWDPTRHPKLGHTSHLLMSFPIGTKPEHVREVARDLCEQFFQGEGAHFDFLVAVHTDRAHPHAHIVLNRRSKDGEVFFLKRGHHFNYQVFREAMVEHGDRHGLRLQAARRLDRGVLTYTPRSIEVQRAREEGRAPVERPRLGSDLDRALQRIALARSTYRELAVEASRSGFEEVSDALLRAGAILARGDHILPQGGLYMADDQDSFDTLVREFSQGVRAVESRIAAAAPAERPRMEQQLHEVLASVSHMNPLGRDSASLREAPSPDGLYSRANIDRAALDRRDPPQVTAALDAALRGTGLSTAEVLARLRVGADSAALEHHWLARDARVLAQAHGLDPAKEEDFDQALDRLEETQARVTHALTAAGVLRHGARSVTAVDRSDPLEAVVLRLRDERASTPAFVRREDAQAFRHEIERSLTPEQIERLAQGETEVLADLAEEPLDRLLLAKAYAESQEGTPPPAIHARLVDAISEAQIDAQRLRQVSNHRGPIHG